MYCVYRIYYDDEIIYVGRTNNIKNRIRQHITSGKLIDANRVSKIEYAELETEADMNLYELYYILKLKPILNSKDITTDKLTVSLDDLEFKEFYHYLYKDWQIKGINKQSGTLEIISRMSNIKSQLDNKNISKLEKDLLNEQYLNLYKYIQAV